MRSEDWPTKLKDAIDLAEDQIFSWGETDCFYWTNQVVKKMTGTDYMREFFAKQNFTPDRPYMSGKGMLRTIKKLGYDSFFEIVCAMYGEPINPKMAHRGDLLMKEVSGFSALGICRGIDVMFKTREGNLFFPPATCEHAWRIV